jgi:hypothetical protein
LTTDPLNNRHLVTREKKAAPTLQQFIEQDFIPFVRTTKVSKLNTVRFYENSPPT